MIGQTVSHYEITSKIGEGGMGEVYRATDTKLNRDVALKVLPEIFANDSQRMVRFEREAQVLASLNHPNIAAIYGLEDANDTKALVMELVEGEDLSERIARGPIPLDEALPIALQIAEALEDAHEKGIIHRDLKPANIKLTSEGKVKVLDFGLAKALEEERTLQEISNSPTLTMQATQAGIILGTAAYMSPEQARGKLVDRRADTWAMGAMLFEMLTGKQAFQGSDLSETMANVINQDPDWSQLPSDLPVPILRLIQRSLRKDLAMRLPGAAMARITIQEYFKDRVDKPDEIRVAKSFSGARTAAVVLVALVLGMLMTQFFFKGSELVSTEVTQLDLVLDPPTEVSFYPSFSPDGRTLVYPARVGGTTVLYRRGLSEEESARISGTEGARLPFFSPDGRWVAFFGGGRVKKVLLAGGQPIPVATYAGGAFGGVWTKTNRMVILTSGNPYAQVIDTEGGTPRTLTPQGEDNSFLSGQPQLLPDGINLLLTIRYRQRPEEAQIGILNSSTGSLDIVAPGSDARFVAPNFLVYLHADRLMAAPFDPVARKLTASPRLVPVDLEPHMGLGGKYFRGSLSPRGTAILEAEYAKLTPKVVWTDWEGTTVSERVLEFFIGGEWGSEFLSVRLSPDGKKLLVAGAPSISVVDPSDGNVLELYHEQASLSIAYAHWHPDGSSIAFIGNSTGKYQTYGIRADGRGQVEPITNSDLSAIGLSFSPDGKFVLGYKISPQTSRDLWLFPVDKSAPIPILQTPSNERGPTFSPDGKLIAFVSDEDGTDQLYVREFPSNNPNRKVSTEGGTAPRWSRDGKNLFYRTAEALMRIEVRTEPVLQFSRPEPLFDASRFSIEPFGIASYDVSLDGTQFLFPFLERQGLDRWHVILNWNQVLEKLMAD